MSTITERIKEFNSNRIPAYTTLKYKLMSESPFRFFRGTCHLFYEDMQVARNIPASPTTWICGDLHLENFGTYKGDNRLVFFDLNDFDEAVLAPAVWDVNRMVTSIFVALQPLVGNQKEIEDVATLFLQTYSAVLKRGKARYIEQLTAKGITRSFLDKVCERKQKDLLEKRTVLQGDRLNLRIDNTKLFPIEKTLKKELISHLAQWIQNQTDLHHDHEVLDVGFRIAGTGSIGINRYLFLVKKTDADKYLFIDMKQAMPSSLMPYCNLQQPQWASNAERIVSIQDRMQNVDPALLSTTTFNNDVYVLKEMQPSEDKIDFQVIRDRYKEIARVIKDMALLTASAILRSSGRQGSAVADELITFGGGSEWHSGVLDYTIAYARKVNEDYNDYLNAYKSGFFQ